VSGLAAEKNKRIANLQNALKDEQQRRKQLEVAHEQLKAERHQLQDQLKKAASSQGALERELTMTEEDTKRGDLAEQLREAAAAKESLQKQLDRTEQELLTSRAAREHLKQQRAQQMLLVMFGHESRLLLGSTFGAWAKRCVASRMEKQQKAVERDLSERAAALAADSNARVSSMQAALDEEKDRRVRFFNKHKELDTIRQRVGDSLRSELSATKEAKDSIQLRAMETEADLFEERQRASKLSLERTRAMEQAEEAEQAKKDMEERFKAFEEDFLRQVALPRPGQALPVPPPPPEPGPHQRQLGPMVPAPPFSSQRASAPKAAGSSTDKALPEPPVPPEPGHQRQLGPTVPAPYRSSQWASAPKAAAASPDKVQEIKDQEADHHVIQEQKLDNLQKQVTEMNEALKVFLTQKNGAIDGQQKQVLSEPAVPPGPGRDQRQLGPAAPAPNHSLQRASTPKAAGSSTDKVPWEQLAERLFGRLDPYDAGFVESRLVLKLWPQLSRHLEGGNAQAIAAELKDGAAPVTFGSWMSLMVALQGIIGSRHFRSNIFCAEQALSKLQSRGLAPAALPPVCESPAKKRMDTSPMLFSGSSPELSPMRSPAVFESGPMSRPLSACQSAGLLPLPRPTTPSKLSAGSLSGSRPITPIILDGSDNLSASLPQAWQLGAPREFVTSPGRIRPDSKPGSRPGSRGNSRGSNRPHSVGSTTSSRPLSACSRISTSSTRFASKGTLPPAPEQAPKMPRAHELWSRLREGFSLGASMDSLKTGSGAMPPPPPPVPPPPGEEVYLEAAPPPENTRGSDLWARLRENKSDWMPLRSSDGLLKAVEAMTEGRRGLQPLDDFAEPQETWRSSKKNKRSCPSLPSTASGCSTPSGVLPPLSVPGTPSVQGGHQLQLPTDWHDWLSES